jgi:competence ComEA-like helix-hairpin-helix protein
MSLKHTLKESLTFSKKERVGIIILLPAILIVAFLPFGEPRSPVVAEISPSDSVWLAKARGLQENNRDQQLPAPLEEQLTITGFRSDDAERTYNNTGNGILFSFDPNTLDADGFKKLGLRDKTIRTLLNYRNKGGRFRKPEDLGKIYGLRQEEYQRLRPYIAIAGGATAAGGSVENRNYSSASVQNTLANDSKPLYTPKIIEINSADVAAFESLHGIGYKLATRIINFREKLGGFYSVDQVGETYGVPDSTFQKIKSRLKVDPQLIKKIDINKAGYDELNNHPYISARLAFRILKQRKESGHFSTVEEIKESVAQTAGSYEKVSAYITAGN